MVASLDEITEKDFQLYTPDAIYFDERPEVLIYHKYMKNLSSKEDIITEYVLFYIN